MLGHRLLIRSMAMARQVRGSQVIRRPNLPVQTIGSRVLFNQRTVRREYGTIQVDKPAKELTFEEMRKLRPSDDLILIDVREPDEYNEGHIPGALNIPYKSSPGALGLSEEEFQETFGFSKPAIDKNLVFYCRGGVRSTAAEELAATYGYENRGNYKGSFVDWLNNKGEVEV